MASPGSEIPPHLAWLYEASNAYPSGTEEQREREHATRDTLTPEDSISCAGRGKALPPNPPPLSSVNHGGNENCLQTVPCETITSPSAGRQKRLDHLRVRGKALPRYSGFSTVEPPSPLYIPKKNNKDVHVSFVPNPHGGSHSRMTPFTSPFPPRLSSLHRPMPTFDDIEAAGDNFQNLPPRPERASRASRAFRTSIRGLKHLSLTPGDMFYPPKTLKTGSPTRTSHVLGLTSRTAPSIPSKPVELLSLPIPLPQSPNQSSMLPTHQAEVPFVPEPLNGRAAWAHALAAFLVVFNCWGLSTSFGLFQAYYTTTLLPTTSPSAVAWIGSTQLALVFGLGVPVGRLVDAGYFRPLFHGGSVLLVLGVLMTAQCRSWLSLWMVQGVVTGTGMGSVFCAGVVVLMGWFDERRMGIAMGFGAAGSCVGAIVYAVLAQRVLETRGFEWAVRSMALLVAITMIPPNLVFRVRKTVADQDRRGKFSWKWKRHLHVPAMDWKMFTDTSYLLVAGGMFFAFMGVYIAFVFIISYGIDVLSLAPHSAVNLLIFASLASLPGRFLPALISDRCIGPLNTIIPSALLSSAIVWLWTASNNTHSSLIVIACFYGFVSAGVQVLYAPAVYAVCLSTQPASRGKAGLHCHSDSGISITTDGSDDEARKLRMDKMGVKAGGVFSVIGLGCLIGTPIAGALIKYRQDRGLSQPYLGAQVFAGSCLLLGGCFLLAARVAKNGWAAKRA